MTERIDPFSGRSCSYGWYVAQRGAVFNVRTSDSNTEVKELAQEGVKRIDTKADEIKQATGLDIMEGHLKTIRNALDLESKITNS